MTLQTDRLRLPLLATAQAQKEMTHNEALTLLDAVVQPVVVAVGTTAPPAAPVAGQAWIVGAGATGAWAGYGGALAVSTAGGWRFVTAFDGLTVWSLADDIAFRRQGGAWLGGMIKGRTLTLDGLQVVGSRGAPIVAPTGGTTIDTQARSALSSILATLRTHGLIAT